MLGGGSVQHPRGGRRHALYTALVATQVGSAESERNPPLSGRCWFAPGVGWSEPPSAEPSVLDAASGMTTWVPLAGHAQQRSTI